VVNPQSSNVSKPAYADLLIKTTDVESPIREMLKSFPVQLIIWVNPVLIKAWFLAFYYSSARFLKRDQLNFRKRQIAWFLRWMTGFSRLMRTRALFQAPISVKYCCSKSWKSGSQAEILRDYYLPWSFKMTIIIATDAVGSVLEVHRIGAGA
jgi:hypothetical protein